MLSLKSHFSHHFNKTFLRAELGWASALIVSMYVRIVSAQWEGKLNNVALSVSSQHRSAIWNQRNRDRARDGAWDGANAIIVANITGLATCREKLVQILTESDAGAEIPNPTEPSRAELRDSRLADHNCLDRGGWDGGVLWGGRRPALALAGSGYKNSLRSAGPRAQQQGARGVLAVGRGATGVYRRELSWRTSQKPRRWAESDWESQLAMINSHTHTHTQAEKQLDTHTQREIQILTWAKLECW